MSLAPSARVRPIARVAALAAVLGSLLASALVAAPANAAPAHTNIRIDNSAPAAAKSYKTIAYGSRGSAVRYVQKRLGVIQTGYFGRLTRAAVIRYERRHGLAPDGRVTKGNWKHFGVPYVKASRTRSTAPSRSTSGSGGRYAGACRASYYWQPQPVASGGRFNPEAMTAAHKTLRFGTRVRVVNLNNGRSAVVRINDRGPYISGRCLDLSRAAMRAVGGINSGVIPVKYYIL